MQIDLTDKTALVTGATTGIGAGTARVLSDTGAHVIITGRDTEKLEAVADSIAAQGNKRPHIVSADLTERSALDRLTEEVRSVAGGVDILVNSAGGSRPTNLAADDEFWDEALALNFTAARRLTTAFLPRMRAARWGRVVNISGSMEPRAVNAATAAKGALHLWSKGLSCDVAEEGITVNCIAPGRITSEQTMTKLHPDPEQRARFIAANIPAGRFGDPEDIGHTIAFLASSFADYITGTVIPVDGGMHTFAH